MNVLKRILLLAVLILAVCPLVYGASISLSWQQNTEPDIQGYRVYYGTSQRSYGPPIPAGKSTSYVIDGLQSGKAYYLAVTAVDNSGNESGYSGEIKATAKTTSSSSGSTSGGSSVEVAAWWTQHFNRSTAVPVQIYDGSKLIATVKVDQTKNGGKWNVLGKYTFSGTPKVVVVAQKTSRSTCADAVRLTYPNGNKTIIDNGKSGTSATGSWGASTASGSYGTKSVYSANNSGQYTFGAGSGSGSTTTADTGTTTSGGSSVEVAAWWTQHFNRNTAVPVQIYDGSKLIATVKVDQTKNGGKWNVLGKYTFSGTPKVVVVAQKTSRSTCADAVRLTYPNGNKTIIDNGKSGTSATGSWGASTASGSYGTKSVYSANNSGQYTFGAGSGSGSTTTADTGTTTSGGSSVEVAAWWTQHFNRNTAVPVQIYDGSKLIATVKVDQTKNGGKWNVLGKYTFSGTPKVVVVAQKTSRSTCADAVRLTYSNGTKTIIDNGKSGTSATGSWGASTASGSYGTKSVYSANNSGTYTFGAGSGSGSTSTADSGTTGSGGSSVEVAAWWTQHWNRNTAVPVQIYDGTTLIATVKVDQTKNGGKWNVLGKYTFSGTPKVVVVAQKTSRSTVADAVRLTYPNGNKTIIDNGKSGTSASGSWSPSTSSGYYGTKSVYSANNSGQYVYRQP